MPMVHLHALLRSTLPVLMAGGEVIAAPGFDRTQVLQWIGRLRPTYFTAAPSLYRALLDEIAATGWESSALRLALIGSDLVDAELMQRIERGLNCAVLQFYALTEASPFVAMTERGMPSGAAMRINPVWRVRIADDGEIHLQGGIINRRLGDGPGTDDWFRTGDLGCVDRQGRLTVTGRSGDRITRGAEKIEPLAIERALAHHRAIGKVCAFGLPDPQLGQVVAAAVELHAPADPETLLAFAAANLAAQEVPERLFVVDRIPTNAAGKVSRSLLAQRFAAERLGRPGRTADAPEDIQLAILDILRRALNNPALAAGADFFADGGGDSFAALNATLEIEAAFATNVPPATFRHHGSAASLAAFVAGRRGMEPALEIVPVRTGGNGAPLFITHSIDGQNSFGTILAEGLADRPVYTFHETRITADDLARRDLPMLARRHISAMRSVQPNGPYHLAGHSWGANLAFEIARHLREIGEPVGFVGLIDAVAMLSDRAFGIRRRRPGQGRIEDHNHWAARAHVAGLYDGAVHYFRASGQEGLHRSSPTGGWDFVARGGVTCIDIEGDHLSIAESSGLVHWRSMFAAALARAEAHPPDIDHAPFGSARQMVLDALVAARQGNRGEEIAFYQQALGMEPDLPFWVHANLSEALFEDGRTEAGVTAYERAVTLDLWPLTSMVRLAPTLKQHRQKALRRAAGASAAKVRIDHPAVAFQKGRVLWVAGRFKEAERAFQRGLRLDPDTMSILVAYGRFLVARGRAREAVALLEDALQRRQKPTAARRHLLRELRDAQRRVEQQPRRHWLRALLGLR
jgi:thioesterase domain-containing protein/Flp pilus assembly protein TadD